MIDPSIALSYKSPEIPDLSEGIMRGQQLRGMQQQQQLQAQQIQMGGMELQQKKTDLEDQQKMRQAWMDASGDPDKMFLLATQRGVGPKTMMATQQAMLQAKETRAKLTTSELANTASKNDMGSALLQPVLAESDPAKQKALWDQQMQMGVQKGAFTPEEAAQHPYPGPDGVKTYAASLATDKWITAQGAKQRGDAATVQAGIAGTKAAAELPGLQARSEQEQRVLAGTNPLGITAEQQATLAGQAAGRAQTAAHNKVEEGQGAGRLSLEQQAQALRQKQFNATIGAGLDANGQPLMGPDGKPVANPTAAAIANYMMPPPSARTLASPMGQNLMRQVMAANPNYDGTRFQQRNKITQDFSASGASGKAITSTDTALAHLNSISQAGQALKSGDVQLINRLATSLGAQVGQSPQVTYDAIVSTVAPEITRAVIGGVGEQSDRQKMEANFSRNLSPEQREGAIAGVANLLGARVHRQAQAYESDMGKPLERKLSPESQAVLDRYTKGQSGAQAPPFPSTLSTSDKGKTFTNRDGQQVKITDVNPANPKQFKFEVVK